MNRILKTSSLDRLLGEFFQIWNSVSLNNDTEVSLELIGTMLLFHDVLAMGILRTLVDQGRKIFHMNLLFLRR